jgi:prephenate dehydrogenase
MTKAPNGIPSVHALWGPAATTKLKITVAMETFGDSNLLMKKLLEKMASNDIAIIETNKPEHDSKMAIIQGLMNLWLVMV